ncbi:MAG: GNAT family N-acetyltransferase [Candidatus Dormibacteraceae bacterium]
MRNPLLVGPRVYLRAMEPGDGDAMAEADAMESDTFMYRGRRPSSPLESEEWIKKAYRERPPKEVPLAVCLRADERLIGVVGVDDLDWTNRTGETFSFLAVEHRGRGLGTEAKHLLLRYAFDRLGLHVLQSMVDAPNTRSAAALVKQGYRRAGIQRWADVKDRRYVDMLRFDLTREDWLAAHQRWQPASGS